MISISLNEISNNFLDVYERYDDLVVTGFSTEIPNEIPIEVRFNNKIYSSKIISNKFSVTISGDDIIELKDNTVYTVEVVVNYKNIIYTDSEDVYTGILDNTTIQQIHCINVVTIPNRRFTSDEEIKEINDTIDTINEVIYSKTIDGGTY